MAFNGSGLFSRLYNWVADRDASIKITASRMDAEMDGMATGLSTCITKDGQTTITANLPMATYKHTGVGSANARTDYADAASVQDDSFNYITETGAADAYVISPSPAITAYAAGQRFTFIATNASTGASTLNVSGLGVKSIVKNVSTALAAGDIAANAIVSVIYDGTNFQLQALTIVSLSGYLQTSDIGVTVQAYDADTTKNDVANTFTATQSFSKGGDIASATTLVLGTDGNYFDVTGSTGPIAAITVPAGTLFMLQFDSTPTLTHHATNLDLPGETDITAVAGDTLIGFATAANQVQVLSYTKASGEPITGGGKILQVIHTQDTTNRTTTSTSYVDSSVSVTGTLTDSANKFRIRVHGSIDNGSDSFVYFTLYRDTTDLTPAAVNCLQGNDFAVGSTAILAFEFEDSPADTSSHTYKLYWKCDAGTSYLGRDQTGGLIDAPTFMTLEEISA